MENFNNAYMMLPGITHEELGYLQQATAGLDENQQKYFYNIYSGKRKSPQDILLFTLLGFVVVAGVQRFVLGQVGMGLLYLFTGGFCLIGTIVDLVNHKDLALEYNKKMAFESMQMVKMGMGY
ncbi:TM2 domain-containing protein [Mucilaginibacter mali]|uniref:TM2 domain-containing protein n=1 Tax=Mucilaginibacter mali TaxID=2740462 RepID=A0A7D4QML7_9SPHI|nr:TM2 domain-containing protein [Mucilaginibacter mali]QKJ31910.1 TM2 domain-containing protein [Mucilaginibacter mali]